jgi:hypothetical protein
MLPDAHLMHGTALMKDGTRLEIIGVIRSPDQSNGSNTKKSIDGVESPALELR